MACAVPRAAGRVVVVVVVALALLTTSASAIDVLPDLLIRPEGAAAVNESYCGSALAAEPLILVVGCSGSPDVAGKVLIYTREALDGAWTLSQSPLTGAGGFTAAAGSDFGARLALQLTADYDDAPDVLVIGEPGAEVAGNADAGRVHVFHRDAADADFAPVFALSSAEADTESLLGWSMDIRGGEIAVGEPYEQGTGTPGTGMVHILSLGDNGNYTVSALSLPPDFSDGWRFGTVVRFAEFDGSPMLVVAAADAADVTPGALKTGRGYVYLYDDDLEAWTYATSFFGAGRGLTAGSFLGLAMDVNRKTGRVAIAAPEQDEGLIFILEPRIVNNTVEMIQISDFPAISGGPIPTAQDNDDIGWSVNFAQDEYDGLQEVLIVSSYGDDGRNNIGPLNQGAVFALRWAPDGIDEENEEPQYQRIDSNTLRIDNPALNDRMGKALAVVGSRTGQPLAVYSGFHDRNRTGTDHIGAVAVHYLSCPTERHELENNCATCINSWDPETDCNCPARCADNCFDTDGACRGFFGFGEALDVVIWSAAGFFALCTVICMFTFLRKPGRQPMRSESGYNGKFPDRGGSGSYGSRMSGETGMSDMSSYDRKRMTGDSGISGLSAPSGYSDGSSRGSSSGSSRGRSGRSGRSGDSYSSGDSSYYSYSDSYSDYSSYSSGSTDSGRYRNKPYGGKGGKARRQDKKKITAEKKKGRRRSFLPGGTGGAANRANRVAQRKEKAAARVAARDQRKQARKSGNKVSIRDRSNKNKNKNKPGAIPVVADAQAAIALASGGSTGSPDYHINPDAAYSDNGPDYGDGNSVSGMTTVMMAPDHPDLIVHQQQPQSRDIESDHGVFGGAPAAPRRPSDSRKGSLGRKGGQRAAGGAGGRGVSPGRKAQPRTAAGRRAAEKQNNAPAPKFGGSGGRAPARSPGRRQGGGGGGPSPGRRGGQSPSRRR